MLARKQLLRGLPVLALGMALGAAVLALGCEQADEPPAGEPGATSSKATDERRSESKAAGRPFLPEGAERSFARFAATIPGRLAIAVAPVGSGRVHAFGDPARAHAWSTIKVPLVLALARARGGFERLSAAERELATAAITESDNAAAELLFGALQSRHGGVEGASAAIERELRAGGDAATVVNSRPDPRGFSSYGQTEWPAAAATTFFQALGRGCAGATPADARELLSLMARVVPEQRWGLGEPFGASAALKGGWGPEPSGAYLVRQSGVVGRGRGRYAVTIIAAAGDSDSLSFEEGVALLGRAAAWVEETFGPGRPRAPAACPGRS